MNKSVLRYASKTVLQCSDFTFFFLSTHSFNTVFEYSNLLALHVRRKWSKSKQTTELQQEVKMSTITKHFKCAPKPSEVVSALQSDFMNQEKEEVVKQLSKTEESIKKRCKYRAWIVTEKLEIGEYAILHGVASTLRYSSLKYPGISKQSITDFKKVCKQMSVKVSIFISFYSYEKRAPFLHLFTLLQSFKL